MRRFTELSLSSLVVMAYSEVSPNVQVVAMEMVSLAGRSSMIEPTRVPFEPGQTSSWAIGPEERRTLVPHDGDRVDARMVWVDAHRPTSRPWRASPART